MHYFVAKIRNYTRDWRVDPLVPVSYMYRILRALFKYTLNVVYALPAIVFRAANYRVPNFITFRIGHLMVEPDCFVKEMYLELSPRVRPIMLAPGRYVANQAAISYWKKYYSVVTSPFAVLLLRPLSWHPLTAISTRGYAYNISGTVAFPTIQKSWTGKPPLLAITESDVGRGEECLAKMGVPPGTWFVCIHSREGGYTQSHNDEDLNGYRNSDIDNYLAAADHIISLGGMCIRMGDPSMTRIPKKLGLIDYAHHPDRCDWLDLYISARCRFFLGNSSGAFFMSAVFGVPVACANMVPMSGVFPFGANDISIPKLYRDTSSGRLLPFKQVLDHPMGNFRMTIEFNRQGIELVENSPDEISELQNEQLRRLADPSFSYSVEDELLQQRFRELFRPGHHSYGSASRVGTAFLRKYQHLLP